MMSVSYVDFDQLSPGRLYELLRLRSRVFVVEQQSIYLDCDDHDRTARHVLLIGADHSLSACARILPPGALAQTPVIGRVVVAPEQRGRGLGYQLMSAAVRECLRLYPDQPIHLSAQRHLHRFYAACGFARDSEPYLEDGIWHIGMTRPAAAMEG